jgi:hypothetical protein
MGEGSSSGGHDCGRRACREALTCGTAGKLEIEGLGWMTGLGGGLEPGVVSCSGDWCHDAGVVVVDFLLKVEGWEMVGADGHLGRGRGLRRGCRLRDLRRRLQELGERLQELVERL